MCNKFYLNLLIYLIENLKLFIYFNRFQTFILYFTEIKCDECIGVLANSFQTFLVNLRIIRNYVHNLILNNVKLFLIIN